VTVLWGKLKDKWDNTAAELAEKPIGNDAAFCEQRGDVEYLASRRRSDMTTHASNDASAETVYVTLTGLPLAMKFDWPFHQSTSGADFFVLHAHVRLEGSGGLTAPVAVNMSATVREVFTSLEAKDTEAPIINAIRKEVDRRQLEFVKSGKLVPLQFSSRHYDFKRNKWVFGKASDEDISLLIARKVFWQRRLTEGAAWIGDPTEALYVETTREHVLELARKLAEDGLMTVEGERASANAALMAQAEKFEADMRGALAELEKKHAFERG
jgi:hypothetical protein